MWSVALFPLVLTVVRAATVCEISGLPPPDVPTLLATAPGAQSKVAIVLPDCTYNVPQQSRGQTFYIEDLGLERVASLPVFTREITLVARLSRGGDFTTTSTVLDKVSLESVSSSASAAMFAFPDSVTTISFTKSDVKDFERLKLPRALTTLSLRENKALASLKGMAFPPSISKLDLSRNQITTMDFALPSTLDSIDLSGNPITSVEGLVLPPSLGFFICDYCEIREFKGIKLPESLGALQLGTLDLKAFEVRQSDLAVVRRLSSKMSKINQPTCADPTAEIVSLPQGNVCVISDDRFEEKYNGKMPSPGPSTSTTTSTPPSPSSAATETSTPTINTKRGGSNSTATSTTPSVATEATVAQGSGRTDAETDLPALEDSNASQGMEESPNAPANSNARLATKSPRGQTVQTTSATASSSQTLAIVLAVVGTVLVFAIGLFVYQRIVRYKQAESYADVETPRVRRAPRSMPKSVS